MPDATGIGILDQQQSNKLKSNPDITEYYIYYEPNLIQKVQNCFQIAQLSKSLIQLDLSEVFFAAKLITVYGRRHSEPKKNISIRQLSIIQQTAMNFTLGSKSQNAIFLIRNYIIIYLGHQRSQLECQNFVQWESALHNLLTYLITKQKPFFLRFSRCTSSGNGVESKLDYFHSKLSYLQNILFLQVNFIILLFSNFPDPFSLSAVSHLLITSQTLSF